MQKTDLNALKALNEYQMEIAKEFEEGFNKEEDKPEVLKYPFLAGPSGGWILRELINRK